MENEAEASSPRSLNDWEEVKSVEEEEESWTEVQSLVSLDSLGGLLEDNISSERPPQVEDLVSDGSEADAAELFFLQNRNEINAKPLLPSKQLFQKPKEEKKKPRWMRFAMVCFRRIRFFCQSLASVPRKARESFSRVEIEERMKKAVRWFMSAELWPWIRNGTLYFSIAACIAFIVQSKFTSKALTFKKDSVPVLYY